LQNTNDKWSDSSREQQKPWFSNHFSSFLLAIGNIAEHPSEHLKVTKLILFFANWNLIVNEPQSMCSVFPHSRALIDTRFLMVNPYIAWIRGCVSALFCQHKKSGTVKCIECYIITHSRKGELFQNFATLRPPRLPEIWDLQLVLFILRAVTGSECPGILENMFGSNRGTIRVDNNCYSTHI